MNSEKLDAQFNRACISLTDFQEALSYLSDYSDSLSPALRRAALVAAVVAYARPFNKSEGGAQNRATAMLAVKPRKVLDVVEFELHEKILDLRGSAIAHSDYDRNPVRRTGSVFENGFVMWNRPFDVTNERIDVDLFKSISKKMEKYCLNLMFSLNRRDVSGPCSMNAASPGTESLPLPNLSSPT